MPDFRVIAPAVQAAIGLAVAAALPAGVACSVGYPVGGLADEQVWVSGDFDAQTTWEVSGQRMRGETAPLEVRISVTQSTEAFADPQARCLELEACVEDAIAADPTLDGLVDECSVTEVKGQEAIPSETSRAYGVVVTVTYSGAVAG
jgi:hypothetical protein